MENKFSIKRLEIIYAILATVFGLLFVFINPPFQSNDEDRHFIKAYTNSEFNFFPKNEKNVWGGEIPTAIVKATNYGKVPWSKGNKISYKNFSNDLKVKTNKKSTTFINFDLKYTPPIAYFPQSLGMLIGSQIVDNPFWLLWFGRLGALFLSILLIYYAIKFTPVYKAVIFLFALTPMVLFQNSSVTYDTLNNSLSLLLVSVALYFAYSVNRKLSTKELILIFLLVALFRFVKGGYVLLPLIFLIIPSDKYSKSYIKYIYISLLFLTYFLPDITWSYLINSMHYTGGIVGQTDFYFNSSANKGFVLNKPFEFISMLWSNILMQKYEWYKGIFGRLGNSYFNLTNFVYFIHSVALIFVCFMDSDNKIKIDIPKKILFLLIGVGSSLLVIVGMYVTATPVGSILIFGLQGRYFIPVVIVLLLTLYNNNFHFEWWDKYRNSFLAIYIIIILTITVMQMKNYFWVA